MSYAAPYPNCSTQYSKSFPLLTTRTHTPNRPSHYYEIHCPTPVDSMSSATRGGGSRTALPSPVVLADAGTHPTPCCPRGCGDPSHPPLSSRMRGPIPPPVVLADAGTHPTPSPADAGTHPTPVVRMRGPIPPSSPSHPLLSSRMRGPIPLPLPSRPSCPMAPLPRRCAPPERPRPYRHPLSSNSHGSGNPSLPPSHLRYTQPPHIIVPSPT